MTIDTNHHNYNAPLPAHRPHEPSVAQTALIWVGLGLVILGDIANFQLALSRYFTTLPIYMIWPLVAGLTAAAVLLMYEAGRAEAMRPREDGARGSGGVKLRVMIWLGLGFAAFLTRLAAPPEKDSLGDWSSPGQAGAGSSGSDTTDSQAFLEIFHVQHNIISALLLFALFLAGGIGAYFIGKESYNPQLTELRRARRRMKKVEKALRKAEERGESVQRSRREAGADTAAHTVATVSRAKESLTREIADHRARLAELEAELDSLPSTAEAQKRAAQAAGEAEKERVSSRIAEHLGDPGATSTIIDGHLEGE